MLAVATAACADTVRLRNGNTIEGVVLQETGTQVVLDLGTGSTTFPRSAIQAVVRASEEENNQLRAEWKQKYFLHREFVPAELTRLAAEFTRLGSLREEARRASRVVADLAVRESRLKTELDQLREQLVQVGHQIQGLPAKHKAEAYNVLITSNNALQVQSTLSSSELVNCQKERASAEEQISAYLETMASFNELFAAERKKTPADEPPDSNRMQFLNRLTQTLAEYAHDFLAVAVAITPSNAGAIVTVKVNDRVSGRFLVDTGASWVTVTESFAQRLQLDLTTLPEMEFSMADGRKTKGHTVVFQSVAVGEARAVNVEAAVLSGRPGEQVDGLLGMSFLRHFAVSLNGSSGKLILRQFAPK